MSSESSANSPPHADSAGAAQPGLAFTDKTKWQQLQSASSVDDMLGVWLQLLCAQISGVGQAVVVLGPSNTGPYAPQAYWPEDGRASPALAQTAEIAMAQRHSIARQVRGAQEGTITASHVAVPLLFSEQLHGVVALACEPTTEAIMELRLRQLQWGVAQVEAIILRSNPALQGAGLDTLRSVLDYSIACMESGSYEHSAMVLVNRLATEFKAGRVMYGAYDSGKVAVVAMSGSAQVNLKNNLMAAVSAAMLEAIEQNFTALWPDHSASDAYVLRAHEQLALAESYASLVSIPVYDQAQIIGALTLERDHPFEQDEVDYLHQLLALCGPTLGQKKLNDRSIVAIAGDRGKVWVETLLGPGHALLKASTTLLGFAILVLTLVHGDYRVRSDAVLEGAIERVVAAPYDGYVSQAGFRAGDVVEEGQVLAGLEEKALRLDLSRWLSQRAQLERQYLEAIAPRERAGTQIFKAQMDQADAQIALLNEQINRSEIKAPFAGVVVSGDLSRSIGEPVERGQVLFKVAPLADYRVALHVDERDIEYIAVGQSGVLLLTSRPGEKLIFEVNRVTPVAEIREGVNTFRVEASLVGTEADLRPGMTGTAKVLAGEYRLIWIWTHRLVEWLQGFLWRWMP